MNIKKMLEDHRKWIENNPEGIRANLSEANLWEANLSGANLSEANLSRANLWEANLSEANLNRANLWGANLIRANLSGANLIRANLIRANLSGANLSGANLSGATSIKYVSFDERGYTLIMWKMKGVLYFNAGCRFFSEKDALAHWGSEMYPDKSRGSKYVKSIRFLSDIGIRD